MNGAKTSAAVLELRDYRLRKFARALCVDTDFPPGVNVLLGVNGVGKTTLLTSLVRPSLRARGSRAVVRRQQTRSELDAHRICMLPQKPVIPTHLTVEELLRYCCHLRGATTVGIEAMLGQLGLSHLSDRRVGRLSGGETQRVNLALAFVGRPDLALLDEPSVALDPIARARFAESLRSLTTNDAIVLMSTHVASDIAVADRVFLMSRTSICWEGTAEDFLANAPDRNFDTAFARLLPDTDL